MACICTSDSRIALCTTLACPVCCNLLVTVNSWRCCVLLPLGSFCLERAGLPPAENLPTYLSHIAGFLRLSLFGTFLWDPGGRCHPTSTGPTDHMYVTSQRFLVHYYHLASRSLWGKQPCNVYKLHWKESVLPEIRGGDGLEFCRQSLLLSTMWQGNKDLGRAKMLISKKGLIKTQHLQSAT